MTRAFEFRSAGSSVVLLAAIGISAPLLAGCHGDGLSPETSSNMDPPPGEPVDPLGHAGLGLLAPSLPSIEGRAGPSKESGRAGPANKRSSCPLNIEPGVALGGIALGQTRADISARGLPSESTPYADVVKVGATRVRLRKDKVVEVWIEDVREVEDCLQINGNPFPRNAERSTIQNMLRGCDREVWHWGGALVRCEDGGVYLGYGTGEFLQMRVRPLGAALPH